MFCLFVCFEYFFIYYILDGCNIWGVVEVFSDGGFCVVRIISYKWNKVKSNLK